ncbi:MAG: ribonuclease H-like domain-containing protein [Nitrospirales bacterium]
MIQSTFIFLNGIGESTERLLWETGISSWDAFLESPKISCLAPSRKSQYDVELRKAKQQWLMHNSRFFAQTLKARDHWRLYPHFRPNTAFLDIETTGQPFPKGDLTVVGIYGKGRMTSLVQGDTLTEHRLQEELASYDLLVTFFGSGFDLPFLKAKYPHLVLDQPHIDLCFAARRLGLKGGLKSIEIAIGCYRPASLAGLTGLDAVRLWEEWQHGQTASGKLLIDYNEADCRNLEPLADLIYDRMVHHYGPPERILSSP